MRLSKNFVLKQAAVVAGLLGVGTLLSLPALAANARSHGLTIAQSSGGSAYENAPDSQTLPDASAGERNDDANSNTPSMNEGTSGSTGDEGFGSGQGGVDSNNPVNPTNPDATGGGAFERAPGTLPLPGATQQPNDSDGLDNQSGTTDSEGTGGGPGGYTNPVNPTNPDATGGEAFERVPSTQPLPGGNR